MLEFNSHGFLKPSGAIASSLEEMKEYFVDQFPDSPRREHFERFVAYSQALKKVLGDKPIRYWINGSFVTKKRFPNDIDVVAFIDQASDALFHEQLAGFRSPNCQKAHGIDGYFLLTYPEGHPHKFYESSDTAYWLDHFSKTRADRHGRKHEKGFLDFFH